MTSSLVPSSRTGSATVDPAITADSADVPVVVQARPGRSAAAADAAVRAGARLGLRLPIIDGFSARLPGPAVATLAESDHVLAVTLDRPGAFQSTQATGERRVASQGSAFTRATEASTAWNLGLRGTDVNVAVLDTGISPTADVADRLVVGPDLSGEATPVDSYGHGTVMAGIIAGNGQDSNGLRSGVAPDAGLVSVKVAGRNGAVDVSTVLDGMAWVSAYRQQLGIRVLSLSYGTRSTQDPAVDPLNFAVQRLWAQGIVVVVAAGNGGPGAGTITKPGDDPVVITVGAYDDRGDAWPDNDTVPAWSSQGPTAQGVAKPDLVAPGRTVVATRSPGSTVEEENQDSLVAPSYIKGSGTSEATAVTAGLVALLLQARPMWTPDQVKRALTSTALPLSSTAPAATGHGRAQILQAMNVDPGPARQQPLTATGRGSIEASRGDTHVTTACGEIVGEIDVFCQPWDGSAWSGSAWSGSAWSGSAWSGSAWSGSASSSARPHGGGHTLTAFWGDRPKRGAHVAGERSAA